MIRFPLSDFTRFIGADHKSHYQRKKVLQIFKDLEAFQIFKLKTFTLEDFDDLQFCYSLFESQKERQAMDCQRSYSKTIL